MRISILAASLLFSLSIACAGFTRPPRQSPTTAPGKESSSVTGEVASVDPGKREIILVANVGGKDSALLCVFRKDESARLLRVRPGQQISIMGNRTGNKDSLIALEDCFFQD